MEDDLQWKGTFSGRRPSKEDSASISLPEKKLYTLFVVLDDSFIFIERKQMKFQKNNKHEQFGPDSNLWGVVQVYTTYNKDQVYTPDYKDQVYTPDYMVQV